MNIKGAELSVCTLTIDQTEHPALPRLLKESFSYIIGYFPSYLHRYPDIWYEEITSSSRFFSLAATLNHNIIGLLVAEVKTKSLCNKEVI